MFLKSLIKEQEFLHWCTIQRNVSVIALEWFLVATCVGIKLIADDCEEGSDEANGKLPITQTILVLDSSKFEYQRQKVCFFF